MPQVLPDDYYLLLRLSNVDEMSLPVGPFNFALDAVEVVLDPWEISH
ncbi:hypothetical protein [Pseudomonas huanghezhanensis]|nr:hypothetical protein [Pseudomonas sp. BSw22131]